MVTASVSPTSRSKLQRDLDIVKVVEESNSGDIDNVAGLELGVTRADLLTDEVMCLPMAAAHAEGVSGLVPQVALDDEIVAVAPFVQWSMRGALKRLNAGDMVIEEDVKELPIVVSCAPENLIMMASVDREEAARGWHESSRVHVGNQRPRGLEFDGRWRKAEGYWPSFIVQAVILSW
jgi:hypothetical protein